MRSQNRASIDAIAENERRKLKAKFYEEAAAIVREAVDAAIALSTDLRMGTLRVMFAAKQRANGQPILPIAERVKVSLENYKSASDAILKIIFLLERSRFIDSRILVFRTAMNVCLHDLGRQFFEVYVPMAAPAFPIDTPNGETLPYAPPPEEAAAQLYAQAEKVNEILVNVGAYCEDLLVELQNALLGDLFGTEIEARKPNDPNCKVIRLKAHDELEKWFGENSEWGKQLQKYQPRQE